MLPANSRLERMRDRICWLYVQPDADSALTLLPASWGPFETCAVCGSAWSHVQYLGCYAAFGGALRATLRTHDRLIAVDTRSALEAVCALIRCTDGHRSIVYADGAVELFAPHSGDWRDALAATYRLNMVGRDEPRASYAR